MAIVKEISKSMLLSGDLLERLRFAFAADMIAFKNQFSKHGIGVESDEDLQTLAKLHNTGKDRSGEVVDSNGKNVIFDVNKILYGYDISPYELNRSGIVLID